jgi:4-hydroxyphenylacetate 3-monooxygenase
VLLWSRQPYALAARHEADYPLSLKTASIEAVDRHKLYKLAWDLVGSEFAGRHMLYEKFYAGNSLIVRNQSDREAPWQKFHDTVDGLLARIAVPEPGDGNRRN